MATAYIGVGSNMGNRLGFVSHAIDGVAHLPGTHVEQISHAYESEAAYDEQQPAFVNAVIEVSTSLPAEDLLGQLDEIERALGRTRTSENGPRTVDLDLLLYGEEEWNTERLTLPHPRLLERDFVVTPLLEIAPNIVLPDGTRPSSESATVGRVTSDLGEVPDAGLEHNMAVDDDAEWVEVAQSEGPQSAIAGFDAQLDLKRGVLEQEGVPYAFDPFPPGSDVDILGRQQVIRLLVPAEYGERAIALLDAVEDAPTVEPLEQAAEEASMHGRDIEPE